jgi:hypothetical protein
VTAPLPDRKSELDWARFSAAYSPRRRPHDREALTAYGEYRRSRVDHERPAGDVRQTAAVAAWEDEAGPVL